MHQDPREICTDSVQTRRIVLLTTTIVLQAMTAELKGIQLVVNYDFPDSVEEYLVW